MFSSHHDSIEQQTTMPTRKEQIAYLRNAAILFLVFFGFGLLGSEHFRTEFATFPDCNFKLLLQGMGMPALTGYVLSGCYTTLLYLRYHSKPKSPLRPAYLALNQVSAENMERGGILLFGFFLAIPIYMKCFVQVVRTRKAKQPKTSDRSVDSPDVS